MWYKYLVILVRDQNVKIGIKFEETKKICIIGGSKRFIGFMKEIAKVYFGVPEEKIHSTLPQTYKVRLTFECSEEMVERCKKMMRDQTEFQLVEVSVLNRMMR